MSELLQDKVATRAEQRPDALAVVLQDARLTYAELEAQSNRLARLLRAAGLERGGRVCLLMPKSPAVLVAMLGVLKADAIYVPLDPASPASRLAKMIDACNDRWILAAGPVEGALGDLLAEPEFAAAHSVGWMSADPPRSPQITPQFSLADLGAYPSGQPVRRNGPDDAVHILFTSGSTGVPKGVVITHRNVIPFLDWAHAYFATSPSDHISWHPPLQFDLSTFDVFGTLRVGATLYPVPRELALFPHKLAQFIRDTELTQWFSVPSVLNYVAKFDALRDGDFPALRRVLWCGEVLPTPTLMYWMKRVCHAAFTNLYGPTETTVASSYYTVAECPTDERAEIPIGRACPGEELFVLDESLRPVAPGDVGDLYIGGVGLSPGYWRDADKTRSAFPQYETAGAAPRRIYRTGDLARLGANGLAYYVGRSDTQIKSRGYRIELGEIEVALHSFPCLKDCAVVAVPSSEFDGMAICCAYVVHGHVMVTATTLREDLSKLVPTYMLPSRWLALDDLPKNANGKIDRRLLKETFLQPGSPGVAQSAALQT
jgi:amino acid adenylation domain-containing protein